MIKLLFISNPEDGTRIDTLMGYTFEECHANADLLGYNDPRKFSRSFVSTRKEEIKEKSFFSRFFQFLSNN